MVSLIQCSSTCHQRSHCMMFQSCCRNGRIRGGKLVVRPTDLSEVVDVSCPEVLSQHLASGALQKHNLSAHAQPSPSTSTTGSSVPLSVQSDLKAFTFSAHPGLVLLPGALGLPQQLDLMRAALEEYPEPPAHTNHTLAYGSLPGIWLAAQQGLNLRFNKREVAASAPQQPGPCGGGQGGCHGNSGCGAGDAQGQCKVGGQTSCSSGTQHQQQGDPQGGAGAHMSVEAHSSEDTSNISNAMESTQGGSTSASKKAKVGDGIDNSHEPACSNNSGCSSRSGNSSGGSIVALMDESSSSTSGRTFQDCWEAHGSGPAAAQLLRKLRWATLGPQFNWTKRVYELDSHYR